MRKARLRKGEAQVSLKVTLEQGGQVNETRSVTWEVEPVGKAKERFKPLEKMVMTMPLGSGDDHARNLLRAVLEHIVPLVEHSESSLPRKPTTEHPVIADIRAFLKE